MEVLKIFEATGWVIGIVVAIYAFVKFIDYRVQNVIRDPEFLKGLMGTLRPYAIFDQKQTILVDRGAMAFIESIEVVMTTDTNSPLPKTIIVRPKVHLEQAPIVIPLDTDISTITESRGKKFDWEYEIAYTAYGYKQQRRFSIEILR